MDYESLTEEEKLQIINNRIRQYETEHFNHELNIETLKTAKLDEEQKKAEVARAKESMAALEKAIILHRGKLNAVKKKTPVKGKKAE